MTRILAINPLLLKDNEDLNKLIEHVRDQLIGSDESQSLVIQVISSKEGSLQSYAQTFAGAMGYWLPKSYYNGWKTNPKDTEEIMKEISEFTHGRIILLTHFCENEIENIFRKLNMIFCQELYRKKLPYYLAELG